MCKINCSGGCPECAPDEHKPHPHKHAALIKAWAEGATIEYREYPAADWHVVMPTWCGDGEYRIKPAPKSLGQIVFNSLYPDLIFQERTARRKEEWEAAAQAVVAAYKERQ